MLGLMYTTDPMTQDGAEGCFTLGDESAHQLSATSLQSYVSESSHRVSASDLLVVTEQQEKLPYTVVGNDKLFSQLTSRWTDKKDQVQATRDEIRKIAQQILLDALASEWLVGDTETTQVRIYIVDLILPTLIPGLEKLLLEVEKRDLVETQVPDRNFNPINVLAQYLMRNNPRYSNFSEASPYIRGLRSVAELLKLELFHATEYKYVNQQLMFKYTVSSCTVPLLMTKLTV